MSHECKDRNTVDSARKCTYKRLSFAEKYILCHAKRALFFAFIFFVCAMYTTTSSVAVAAACYPVTAVWAAAQGGLQETLLEYLLNEQQGELRRSPCPAQPHLAQACSESRQTLRKEELVF